MIVNHDPERAAAQLAQRYERAPLVRALVQAFVPYGSIVDTSITALAARLRQIQRDRARTFYDELAAGGSVVSPEIVESDDFLHNHLATVRAVLNTRRAEKVRWLARLLLGTAGDRPGVGADEYEDYLGMLNELSYRELCLLATLAEFEQGNTPLGDESVLGRANRIWPAFSECASQRCLIPTDELDGAMRRLVRTGAYLSIEGTYYDYEGNRGYLTPAYYRLAHIIRLRYG